MRLPSALTLLLALATAAGCGPRPADVAGLWEGRWTAANGQSGGSFAVTVEQRGRVIRGPITLSLEWLPQATIQGTVDGRRLRWGVLRGGVVVLEFEGEVDGDRAQGRYTIGATVEGTWTAQRAR